MDIEGKRRGRRRRRYMIWSDISCFSTDLFSSISSLVCQGYELLCERKKRALAVFFVMLEIISLVLDVFGQSRRSILLAAFLLSVCGFVMTILTCMLERTRVHAEKQLGVVEIGFSVVQLIDTFLAVLGIKINNSYTAPVLLLVFAIINAVFTFIKDENVLGSLSLTNEYENELLSNENELQVIDNLLIFKKLGTKSLLPFELKHLRYLFLLEAEQELLHLKLLQLHLEQLHSVKFHIPSKFEGNPTYWKSHLVKLVQKYNIEVEFCGSGGKLLLDYHEDADNKLLHGDDEWDNKLNMGVKNISMMRRRKAGDRKLKQETEMSVEESPEEEKKSK